MVDAGGGRRAGKQRQERFLTFVRNDGWQWGLSDERHGSASSSKSGRQTLEGCEPAIVRVSLRVEHEKDAEYDHQKGPQPCEQHLPASG